MRTNVRHFGTRIGAGGDARCSRPCGDATPERRQRGETTPGTNLLLHFAGGSPTFSTASPDFLRAAPTFSIASPDFLRASPHFLLPPGFSTSIPTFSTASPDFLRASPHFLLPPRISYGPARIFCGTKIASVHTMRPRVFSLDPNRVSGMPRRSTHRLKQRPATKACRERLQCAATTRAETLEPPSFLHLFPISTPWPPHATACCSLPS